MEFREVYRKAGLMEKIPLKGSEQQKQLSFFSDRHVFKRKAPGSIVSRAGTNQRKEGSCLKSKLEEFFCGSAH